MIACSPSGSETTTGVPASDISRIALCSGTAPRNGTPSLAASAAAPPWPKTSVRPPQCGQTK